MQASSGPSDTTGLYYMVEDSSSSARSRDMQKKMDKLEDGMDAELFRKGVMRKNLGTKCISKVRDMS